MTTYRSSHEYFKREIEAKVKRLKKDPDVVLRPAADTAHAEQVKRIFEDGQDLQGGMGKYQSEEYKRFRRRKGRETSFVNLRLTGQLMRDYSNGNKTRQRKSKLVASVKRKRNADLIEKFQEKYDSPFRLTVDEKKLFRDIAQKEFTRYMNA